MHTDPCSRHLEATPSPPAAQPVASAPEAPGAPRRPRCRGLGPPLAAASRERLKRAEMFKRDSSFGVNGVQSESV